ncbi:hypothetical protein [Kribbella italica]|uniref:Uncharacterized protein n=1 Tax=Kribbella italica TaxID=1540520 RepID=A0A7W9J1F7_9ACTN|nr:hypothetical protein [Kribbella italica]MBB5833380.1 hypothetical protein [Kribbella italica]
MPNADAFERMAPMHNKWQTALNESWPPNARDIPEQAGRPVRARVVWSVDGEEWIDGRATKWVPGHVFVAIGDRRCNPVGFWLPGADAHEKPPTSD